MLLQKNCVPTLELQVARHLDVLGILCQRL